MVARKIKAAGDEGSGVTTQDLLDVLGEEVFSKLREHFSGQEIKVPRYPADDHPLVVALGRDDADFVCENLGTIFIYIPKSGDRFGDRDEFVRRAVAEGIKRADIAKSLDISMRALRRITARIGLSGKEAAETGRTTADVAASLKVDTLPIVELGEEYLSRFSTMAKGSQHGSARHRTMSAAQKTDRRIGDLTTSGVQQLERVFQCYLERNMNQREAAKRAGVSEEQFKILLKRYRETGTIVPPSLLPHAPLATPSDATRSFSTTFENRPSGF